MPPHWPPLTIECAVGETTHIEPAGTTAILEDSATLWLPAGDRIEVLRTDGIVRFVMATPPSAELVIHPLLGLPAAVMSRWQGRLALHGGAFSCAGGAWAVLGDRGSGKSTSLAKLLALGHGIVSDDVLILEGRMVFSGPRSIDLRSEPAELLGGEAMGILGTRERWRLRPGPTPSELPLSGFVELAWGEGVSIEAMTTEERLSLLFRNSAIYPGPTEAAALLELLVLPAWRFVRPHDLALSTAALNQLVACLET